MQNTLNFNDYFNENNHTYSFYQALKDCKLNNANKLIVPKNEYKINDLFCDERPLCISNHDLNGYKKIAVLVEDMNDFEIDFNGSILDCTGILTPIAILNSKNIKISNLTIKNSNTGFIQLRVTGSKDGAVLAEKVCGGGDFTIIDNRFYVRYSYISALLGLGTNVEYNGTTGEIEYATADNTLGVPCSRLSFTETEPGKYIIEGGKRIPPINNMLVISGTRRFGAGVFVSDSENVTIENFNVYSCYGMGFIAQMTKDITLRNFNTVRHDDQYYTSNADATHFVNCTGTVLVENCLFEGQLDDALNIHGMYTRIIDKTQSDLILREMHFQARGIKIYKKGDKIQVLDPNSLIPYVEKTIKDVEYINHDIIRLTLNESTDDCKVGDDVENLTRVADLIFRNNIVRNNRARGILLASKGKTIIEDSYFHTAGTSIKFESDGNYYFESGGVNDVIIRNCTFDKCRHGSWGKAVIECTPRKEIVENKYFHKNITIENNTFDMYNDLAVSFDNIECAKFVNNKVIGCDDPVKAVHVDKLILDE